MSKNKSNKKVKKQVVYVLVSFNHFHADNGTKIVGVYSDEDCAQVGRLREELRIGSGVGIAVLQFKVKGKPNKFRKRYTLDELLEGMTPEIAQEQYRLTTGLYDRKLDDGVTIPADHYIVKEGFDVD